MKLRFIFLFKVLFILSILSVHANNEFRDGDFYYKKLSDNTCSLNGYYGSEEHAEIPSTAVEVIEIYDSDANFLGTQSFYYTVVDIEESALSVVNGPKYISIPSTITKIGPRTFMACDNLEVINIPNSVISIGDAAFADCPKLNSVKIPQSVTSIGNSAFSGCLSLREIVIPNSVTSLGKLTFSECESLQSITLSTNITKIEEGTFSRCSSLKSVNIPEGVTEFGFGAFYGCRDLPSINIPNSVTVIGSTEYTINNYGTFRDCSSLKSISIPANVSYISFGTFYGCTKLEECKISKSSECSFGDSVFVNCSSLKYIELHGSASLSRGMFFGCNNLRKITFLDTEQSLSESIWHYNFIDNEYRLDLPEQIEEMYIGCYWIRPYIYTEANNVAHWELLESSSIPMFKNHKSLKKVEFGNRGEIIIGNNWFEGCTNMDSLIIGKSVRGIGNEVFNDCNSLKYLKINNGKTPMPLGYKKDSKESNWLGEGLFKDCPLEEVYIGRTLAYKDSVQYGRSPFAEQTKLRKVTFGKECKAVGNYMFYHCGVLDKLDLMADSLRVIGKSAFELCRNIKVISLPDSLKSIGDQAFMNCHILSEVNVGKKLTSIGNNAFYACYSLPKFFFPKKMTSIGNGAFGECTNLQVLEFEPSKSAINIGYDYTLNENGEGVKEKLPMFRHSPLKTVYLGRDLSFSGGEEFGYSPFAGNETLKTVVTYDSAKVIKDYSFYNCPKLEKIELGENTEKIGDYAFAGCVKVEEIESKSETPPTIFANTFANIDKKNCKVTVPAESLELYKNAEYWKEFWATESGISDVTPDGEDSGAEYYGADGMKVQNPEKGMFIVRTKDGKARKVVIL